MKTKNKIFFTLFFCVSFFALSAQTAEDADTAIVAYEKQKAGTTDHTKGILQSALVGLEYRVKAGIALGGTAPLPIPAEIREINSFNPLTNLSIEGEIMKTFTDRWGLSFGLRLENKGMKTNARVESYKMSMVADDGEVSGYFWGSVVTRVSNSYLTLPVLAVWKPAERWEVKAGLYGSYRTSGEFSGTASAGYLREGSPVGDKIEISTSQYNFSDKLCRWAYGVQVGADFRAFSHLVAGIDITWGLSSILQDNFDAISFPMYPIYGRLSFGYAF
jgi:hypothetical protein